MLSLFKMKKNKITKNYIKNTQLEKSEKKLNKNSTSIFCLHYNEMSSSGA